MHTKQWLNKQGTWPNNGLLGCGGHGCLGLFERHKYEVVGSSNPSILYLGTSELKVISMIYALPYLMRRRFRRCSRSQARIVSESNRRSTQEGNTGKAINDQASITTKQPQASTEQEGNMRHVDKFKQGKRAHLI